MKYVGHVVSASGIDTDPNKIGKVKNWTTPENSDDFRRFIAFAGYYRKFVKDCSKVL